ncbi:related to hsp70 protein [Ramularia collo-cygni]|uniref:Related to hsp70 protein n=1 Tax=Ramularia collo-cygni TaxID=112498 RepID=A0A2D3V2I1_9PEZI|nr:related to hsp70 protein [Ramularia collo-cygni]CZT22028.1 related to hsp70 protein [Ramularia collo-cygni]
MEGFTWMKLLLDPSETTKFDDPSLGQSEGNGVLARPPGKSAVDLCADYLTEVAIFAYSSLEKRVTRAILEATPIDFWFTVPAVWSDKAKYDTLRAAKMAFKQAGIALHPASRLFLIPEPEAAAIATLSHLTKGASEVQVKPGDSILICDCGGGTVDITSYKINAVLPKLTFEELVVGTGGKCGSTYIDREFIKWMAGKFGPAYTNLSWEKRGPASRFMKDFEGFKRNFKTESSTRCCEAQLFMKGLGDSHYYDADESAVKIHYEDMKIMFDTVVNKIIALLKSQLDAVHAHAGTPVKTIILAGGFGDSNYLNETLRTWCKGVDVKLICPEHPQAAIVRGAALGGLQDIQPTSRRARMHYGIAVSQPFDPVIHQVRDSFADKWDGSPRAGSQIKWSLNKGGIVDRSTQIQFDLTSDVFDDNQASIKHDATVYCSRADAAPRTTYAPSSQVLGVIGLSFRDVNLDDFPVKVINGRNMRRVKATYVVSFGDLGGVLKFSASVGSVEIGNTSFTFDGPGSQQHHTANTEAGDYMPPCAMQ